MLAAHARIADQELLEKDVRLHLLLEALAADAAVGPELIFKGGTCLIKCYLDDPRFSADLDFTWRPVTAWETLGTKELRRALRPPQRSLLDRLQAHAAAQGLAVDPSRDVQYGQSNRMMTALLRYESIARLPGLIKVQINFAEPLLYPARRLEARGLLGPNLPAALALLDSDLPTRYARPVRLDAYDAREILAEKGRAILTRQAAKTRDLLDLFLLETRLGLRIEDHADAIEAKTRSAIERAHRYRERLDLAQDRFDLLLEEDVRPMLLKPVDGEAFRAYRARALSLLARVAGALRSTAGG
ncbi:MAG: nucleotidyl transferase AbiEii/AbiGii toxin family protein [Methanobacteriota archaeon]